MYDFCSIFRSRQDQTLGFQISAIENRAGTSMCVVEQDFLDLYFIAEA
jgi:hypothetical protein